MEWADTGLRWPRPACLLHRQGKMCCRRNNRKNVEANRREMSTSQIKPPGGVRTGTKRRDYAEMERGKIGFEMYWI